VPLEVNGWTLLYHPLFGERYIALRAEVRRLKRRLTPKQFRQHPTVKLTAAVHRLVTQTVPPDPNPPEFWLKGDLARLRRAKGHGLPPRFRLFWVFSQTTRTVIFLHLNDDVTLRKEGASTDPYHLFAALVSRGAIGEDYEANRRVWERARARAAPGTTSASRRASGGRRGGGR
jgi:toxin YhaV